jgi:hypothetical protein
MNEQRRQAALARKRQKAAKRDERRRLHKAQLQVRKCGGCRACCFVFTLPEFGKRAHEWCRHVTCDGCGVHDQDRPPVCTVYRCGWLSNRTIPDRFRPDRSGIIIQPRCNDIVHVVQIRAGAARTGDVGLLVDAMKDAGHLVYITYEGPGTPEHSIYARRSYWPALPASLEELDALMDPSRTRQAVLDASARFQTTGECQLWVPKAG